MSENYKFVQNSQCEYFPCHKIEKEESFNCLFCFCPLYMLKDQCGGKFKYKKDVKDCTDCDIPHHPNSHAFIMKRMKEIIAIGSERTK